MIDPWLRRKAGRPRASAGTASDLVDAAGDRRRTRRRQGLGVHVGARRRVHAEAPHSRTRRPAAASAPLRKLAEIEHCLYAGEGPRHPARSPCRTPIRCSFMRSSIGCASNSTSTSEGSGPLPPRRSRSRSRHGLLVGRHIHPCCPVPTAVPGSRRPDTPAREARTWVSDGRVPLFDRSPTCDGSDRGDIVSF